MTDNDVYQEQYGDGALRGMHRIAVGQPDEMWPASVVARLIEEIICRRGNDPTWLVLHPARRRTP
jgi:hypothetical protein